MYRLNFRQVSYALSEALDMVGVDDLYHGKRVAFMSSVIGLKLGFSQNRIDDLINIGMLHDCGVSNTDVHMNLVKELDWEGSQNHCVRGAELVKQVEFYKNYSDVILYHHTHWSELEQLDIPQEVKTDANIILLTDRVDALRAQQKTRPEILVILQKQSDKMFSSELVDAFIEVSKANSFWFYQEENNLELVLSEWIQKEDEKEYKFEDLKAVACMFAEIVDAKSSFTGEHSVNVSKIAVYLGKKLKLSPEATEKLEIAALLHDLGKLRVDDSILDKPGSLDEQEREVMNRHGFDSEMILRKIQGFKEIATIASSHHETLDGEGYPYKKDASHLSLETRILAVSDIFQALVQNRPYRKSMNIKDVIAILDDMYAQDKLDGAVMAVLKSNKEELYKIAQG